VNQADYDYGVYVLGMYASAANVSQADVIAAYKASYGGDDAVSAVGSMAHGIDVTQIQSKLAAVASSNGDSVQVAQADINQILIDLGAVVPPIPKIAVQAVVQTAEQVGTAAAVVAGGYGLYLLVGGALALLMAYRELEGK
jgi:hypothetical protein